ncbi:MAG: hypothetical protein M3Y26_09705 [Actinomycetota bacterium]|nr:hypothetical protein [Actinomycetota bacterium]
MSRHTGGPVTTRVARRSLPFALTVLVALVAVACGSGATPASSGPGSALSTTNGGATLGTRTGALGTYLTDGAGRSLYLFMSDSPTTSTCNGSCVSAWPPFTSASPPDVSGGSEAGQVGTITRSDGSRQVTYSGHLLYYFSGDSRDGQTNGQGKKGFDAPWWLVSPAGVAITGTGASTGAARSGY